VECRAESRDWTVSYPTGVSFCEMPHYQPSGFGRPLNTVIGSSVGGTVWTPEVNWNAYGDLLRHSDFSTNWNVVAPSGQFVAHLGSWYQKLTGLITPEELTLSAELAETRLQFELGYDNSPGPYGQYSPEWQLVEDFALFLPPFAFSDYQAGPSGVFYPGCPAADFLNDRPASARVVRAEVTEFYHTSQRRILRALKAETERRLLRGAAELWSRARNLLRQVARAFRGTAWSRRLWHLLHGSHPPKSEELAPCQAFGCA